MEEAGGGGVAFAALDAGGEAVGGFEGDLGAGAVGELGEESGFFEEAGRGLGPAIHDGHEEVAAASGVTDGPEGVGLGGLGDALEGAEAGDAAWVDLGGGLGSGDADAGTIIATGAGADDDGGKAFIVGEFGKEAGERAEKIAFLGAFAGEGAGGEGLVISCEK